VAGLAIGFDICFCPAFSEILHGLLHLASEFLLDTLIWFNARCLVFLLQVMDGVIPFAIRVDTPSETGTMPEKSYFNLHHTCCSLYLFVHP
jgi:hypothetical protein